MITFHCKIDVLSSIYRVSQKFVRLISCTITFDENFTFTWNFYKIIISLPSTCIQNFSNWHALFDLFCFFFVTFCSRCGMEWDTACRHDPFCSMIHFELFLSPGAHEQVQPPKQYLFSLDSWKNIYFEDSSKKDNHTVPFHGKAFVLLYKFETSWALLDRLSEGFFFFCHLRGV